MNTNVERVAMGLAGALALFACATAETSQQLKDARSVVRDAEREAAAFAPDRLLAAQQTLEKAEHQDRGSPEERHYAYLADRQARLAIGHAKMARELARTEQAEAAYAATQDELRERAEERLGRAQGDLQATREALAEVRESLASKDGDLGALQEREASLLRKTAELERALDEQEQALRGERQARVDAEQRASAALASLQQIANVKEDARGITVTISGSVLFRTGESLLLPVALHDLDRVGDALEDLADKSTIVVEGHTDSSGSSSYNRGLSQARADTVRNHLIGRGIDPAMIRAVGKGEDEPIADNRTPEGRANNRRVEIEVLHDQGTTPVASR